MFGYMIWIIVSYCIWWLLSRVTLAVAWFFRKPGTMKAYQYIFIILFMFPLVMEILSTSGAIFLVAFGSKPQDPFNFNEDLNNRGDVIDAGTF